MSQPYLLVPLLALAQLVNVSQPGSEPDPTQPFQEDMRLFDTALTEPDGSAFSAPRFSLDASVGVQDTMMLLLFARMLEIALHRRALGSSQAEALLLEQAQQGRAQLLNASCVHL